jgi:uncharacterized protein (DUF362 family)
MSLGSSSTVIQVQSSLVFDSDGKIDVEILHHMLEAGLEAFDTSHDAGRYLQSAFSAAKTIGMKVNTLGGPGASTHVEITNVLSNLLYDAGIARKKHLVWDRSDDELAETGYTISLRGDGPFCYGTDHQGIGYTNELVSKGTVGSLLSNILVEYCDVIINMPVLKDHGIAGVTGALKNHYGSIHNPNKYHTNNCNPYIADLNSLEQIKSKQRLIIMDALNVQYQGGPAYQRKWSAKFGALLLSSDPVAMDSIGWRIIEDLRTTAGLEPLKGSKREPIYIKTAADYGLGNDDPAKIQVKEIKI